MHVRSLIAVAALGISGGAGAEPAKSPAAARIHPAVVQLASAEKITPAVPQPAAEPQPVKRPRAMRITTCRCGDTRQEPQR